MSVVTQRPLLVAILCLLAAMRFGLVPLLEWQAEQRDQLQLLHAQWQRGERAIANQAINQKLALWQQSLDEGNRQFIPAEQQEGFQLSFQRQLQTWLSEHQLELANIDWLNPRPLADSDVMVLPVQIQLQGQGIELLQLFPYLESHQPRVDLAEFSIALRRQTTQDLSETNTRLTLHFYFLPREVSNA